MEKDDEDRRLVHRHLSGDPSGFEQLYRRHRERIFAVLVRMLRNRDDALEATQEVFIRIHRGLDSFDASGRFLTWAFRIATNHAIDRIRRRKVRKETAIVEEAVAPSSDLRTGRSHSPEGSHRLEREEVAAAIHQAVDGLAETHRIVFTLHCYEKLSYGEIAAVLGIPIGTVMSRLYHARRKVRDTLPRDWDPGGPRRTKKRAEE
ncbi:MAG: sigma-70 family RNA polymerase sigma factor [Planctomycetota bacterium]|nr:sigma-70 family RNA polymerase sigma factor [Planctomycetota bacterium]